MKSVTPYLGMYLWKDTSSSKQLLTLFGYVPLQRYEQEQESEENPNEFT